MQLCVEADLVASEMLAGIQGGTHVINFARGLYLYLLFK